ncbi:hypothetical protein Q8A73_016432 [Channa argus]|nr:hypothetical protein Q8A73_016432 [Channa argus]
MIALGEAGNERRGRRRRLLVSTFLEKAELRRNMKSLIALVTATSDLFHSERERDSEWEGGKMSLALCLTHFHTHSHSVSPHSSTVLLSACLFSFHETPVKLRDPLAMPAIRSAHSGSLANHEEIDWQK